MPGRNTGTNTIHFIDWSSIPSDQWKDVAHACIVCNVRPPKDEFNRTRLTFGAQNLEVDIDCDTPKVSRVRLTSSFWGLTFHTIRAWATYFHRSDGMLLRSMKYIVLVPVFLPGIPCANRPILLPNENPQYFLYFRRWIR